MSTIRAHAALCAVAMSLVASGLLAGAAGATGATAAGTPLRPFLGELTLARHGSRLTAVLPVVCPTAATSDCAISAALSMAKPLHGVEFVGRLGSRRLAIAPGRFGVLELRLPAGAIHLADHDHLRLALALTNTDATGTSVAMSRRAAVQIPKP